MTNGRGTRIFKCAIVTILNTTITCDFLISMFLMPEIIEKALIFSLKSTIGSNAAQKCQRLSISKQNFCSMKDFSVNSVFDCHQSIQFLEKGADFF